MDARDTLYTVSTQEQLQALRAFTLGEIKFVIPLLQSITQLLVEGRSHTKKGRFVLERYFKAVLIVHHRTMKKVGSLFTSHILKNVHV